MSETAKSGVLEGGPGGGGRLSPGNSVQQAQTGDSGIPEIPETVSDLVVTPLSPNQAFTSIGKLLSLGLAPIWLRSPIQVMNWTGKGPVQLPVERRGKAPIADGWSSGKPLNYEELVSQYGDGSPGYNIGIRTGLLEEAQTSVIVVDFDSASALDWAHANLPETQIRVMTRKGEHWYYRAIGRVGNRVRIKINGESKFLDIRGLGGLVVAPSSVHGTGIQYRAVMPWTKERFDSMPVFDPRWFGGPEEAFWEGVDDPEALTSSGTEARRPPVYVDASVKRRRAGAYLNNCPPCVSGQGTAQNECLYYARALVYGLCIPPEDAAQIMHKHAWNDSCTNLRGESYPWSLDELRHKCKDAYRLKFNKPYGWLLLDEVKKEADAGGREPVPEDPLSIVVREAADAELEAQNWDFDVPETPVESPGKRGWPLTDSGNAERLAARFGDHLRWVDDRRIWMAWDARSGRWVQRNLSLQRCAKVVARRIADELPQFEEYVAKSTTKLRDAMLTGIGVDAAKIESDTAQRALDAHQKWQKASESVAHRSAMIELASAEPSLALSSGHFDRHVMMINVANGVLDLRADFFKLQPHNRDLYMTKTSPVNWNPAAECPTWDKCLLDWMGGDATMVSFLKRAVGYSITASVEEECFFVMVGGGQNGKSTFLNAIQSVMGPYSVMAPAGLLVETRQDKSTPSQQAGLAVLVGSRLVIASESDDSATFSSAQVKAITTKDRISAKRLYESHFSFIPSHHVFLATNYKPIVSGTDDGIWRRIMLVEWLVRVTNENRDNKLAEKLLSEREGILKWAVEGCLEWQRIGLAPPGRVSTALKEYREEQDTIGSFLSSYTRRDPNGRITKTALREAYSAFCMAEGFPELKAKRFAQEMYGRGYTEIRSGSLGRIWGGITWLDRSSEAGALNRAEEKAGQAEQPDPQEVLPN